MHVEVDDVVIAGAVALLAGLQVAGQRLVGAGAQDVDVHTQGGLAQRLHQRPGDGAVADVARAAGPGGDQQHVDRGRLAQPRLDRLRRAVAAHEGGLQGQRLGQLGVLERLPVQGVELGRAGDLDGQLGQVALGEAAVGGKGLGVGEELGEELLAVAGDAGRGLLRLDLVGEGEAQVLLEVPGQPLLLLGREGIGTVTGIPRRGRRAALRRSRWGWWCGGGW